MFTRTLVSPVLAIISATVIMLACMSSGMANHLLPSTVYSIQEQFQRDRAQKFDEYGAVGECDEKARLDNFVIHLLNEPDSKGYVIGYDGRNDLPARLGLRLQGAQHYLTDARGLNPNRFVVIKGGYREEAATELWIAPKDAPAPEPSNTIIVEKETGQTFKYDEFYPQNAIVQYADEYVYPQQFIVGTAQESALFHLNLSPSEVKSITAQPVILLDVAVDDKAEWEDEDYAWASKDYAQVLEKEQSIACIIYYAQREGGHLFILQQIIEGGQNLLVKKHGIREDRIKIIFGGYRELTTIDLWVVPPGASLPTPTPNYAQDENINESAGEVKEGAKNSKQ